MKLVVGLGNPGEKYQATRHNVGWLVVDALGKALGAGEWRHDDRFEADLVEVGQGQDKLILVKPTTFMNNSGRAVERIRAFYKLDPADIVVIHDELALPLGTLRIRLGGETAGHNGIGSLIHHLGTDQFWRVRIGIETDHPGRSADPTNFVLSRFPADEQTLIDQVIDQAVQHLVDSAFTLEESTITIN
ncbi:aminoacyl-tRNA hydrolase [Candidatus Berkelbacteria bacterium]|nr:aminoacyl-tRNA hydrolase [Candidatus Berkelbacteria bacterium]